MLLLVLLFSGLVAGYAKVLPPFEAPDADAHYKYIVYLHQTRRLPFIDEQHATLSHQLVQQPPLYYLLAALAGAGTSVERGLELLRPNPQYLKGLTFRASATVHNAPWEARLPVWIARAISASGGVLTLCATFLLVRTLFPGATMLAFAVASVVAFNPRFLFSAATITNDAWAAGTAAFAMWLCVRAAAAPARTQAWWWAGCALGLAALAKYSNLALGMPVALILLTMGRRKGRWEWREMAFRTLLLLAGALSVAGFWYLRNLWLYHQLVPLTPMLALLPELARPKPLAFDQVLAQAPLVQNSFWGEFGYGVLSPPHVLQTMQFATLAALAGLALCTLRLILHRHFGSSSNSSSQITFGLVLALLWTAGVLISLINWMRLVNFTAQGRLLYPAIAPIALLLTLGWRALFPPQLHRYVLGTISFLFLLLAISQLGVLADAYRLPPSIQEPIEPHRAIHARFEHGIELIGADLPNGAAVNVNEALPLTLYWTTHQPVEEFLTLFIHLTDEQGTMLYQFDGVPVAGKHPTPQWIPGAVFRDSYLLLPRRATTNTLATLTVGFYPYDDPTHRLAILGPDGRPVDDVVRLARVRIHRVAPTCPTHATPRARWQNGIQLLELDLPPSPADDETMMIRLVWTTEHVLHADYTVFLQALNAQGQVIAQIDRWPQDGDYPTSTWRPGDCVEDVYQFERLPSDWKRIILGLYDAQVQRLLLEDGADFAEVLSRTNDPP
jgi:4-amino-4-deoxy-L-arabinose transferase-like glycosyltransferase